MMSLPLRSTALGTSAAAGALLLAGPTPGHALDQLRHAASAADATAPLVALLSLTAWGLAAWLVLTVALTAAAHLPGLLGVAFAAVARRAAPVAVRRAIEVGLGLTVAVGTWGAAPAAADPDTAAGASVPVAAVSLDWAAQAEAAGPDLDWSAAPPPAAPTPDVTQAVVVAPGDSLWALAEQDLAAHSGTAPTAAAVAQAWPGWWAANRDAVGADPDLIQPGIRLTPPAANGGPSPASS